MSINQEGYLSRDIVKIEEDILNYNRNYFDLAQKINMLGHRRNY